MGFHCSSLGEVPRFDDIIFLFLTLTSFTLTFYGGNRVEKMVKTQERYV